MPGQDIRVKAEDLRALTKALRQHEDGKRLLKELRTELRKVVKPFVPKVRQAIAGIPSKGENARRGRVTLRKRMQKATVVKVSASGRSTGVAVIVSGLKMPDEQGRLPAYMEGTRKRWRHPLFGDKERWQDQSAHPFFYRAVKPAEPRAVRATQEVVERIAREIENA